MADVRALLRSEQVARRIIEGHGEHAVSEVKQNAFSSSKKSKTVENNEHGRKKTKSAPTQILQSHADVEGEDQSNRNSAGLVFVQRNEKESSQAHEADGQTLKTSALGDASLRSLSAINEDEWAAFERDMATARPEQPIVTALNASAVIQAPPLTAAEIASQTKEGRSTQKSRGEAELEGEKEDAARQLASELEEMESLEERVQKLKGRKEALEALRCRAGDPKTMLGADPTLSEKTVPNDTADESDDSMDNLWDAWGLSGS